MSAAKEGCVFRGGQDAIFSFPLSERCVDQRTAAGKPKYGKERFPLKDTYSASRELFRIPQGDRCATN